jgi:hypothetical protein
LIQLRFRDYTLKASLGCKNDCDWSVNVVYSFICSIVLVIIMVEVREIKTASIGVEADSTLILTLTFRDTVYEP